MTDRREGRGRLSSIDLLPEEAEADIVWALECLRERTMPQIAILDEFNGRLADRGIAKVSKSAFSRWSLRKAVQFRRLDEVRAITSDVVGNLGTGGADEVTIAVAEMLKAAVYEALEGDNGPKELAQLGTTLQKITAAQKVSAEHRQKLEAQALAKARSRLENAGRTGDLDAEALARAKRILGFD